MRIDTRKLVIIGVLSAISIVLGLTPGLGFIPIPPASATTMHIPVLIGAILEGPLVGALIGLIFGAFSMLQAVMHPNVLSFAFLNPLVAVLPRILIGVVSYYVYRAVLILWPRNDADKRLTVANTVATGIAAAAGTITNTVGVLGMIYIIYAARVAKAMGISEAAAGGAIAAIGLTNGIPEIIIAVIITIAVVSAVRRISRQ
ncbi:ECF transporter S component [Mahella australiensis]|nr:ECF transporter S component [Mahella australiensis]